MCGRQSECITLQDSELFIGGSSTVGICGTVQPVYGNTCNLETGQQ